MSVIWGVGGAVVSTVKVRRRRGRVGVAGGVDGPDLEGVGAVGERAVGLRRAAGCPVGGVIGVEAALEARPSSSGEEKPKLGLGRWWSPSGPESIWVSGALVSTVKVRLAGVGSGLPAVSMARTSKVWVPSASERVGLRRAAGGPVGGVIGVEAALEARRARRRGEGEAGLGVVGRPRGAGVDLGLGGVGVDGEGAATPGSGRCCRRCRRPGPRRCGCRRRASCRPSASCRRPSRRRDWSRGGTGSSPSSSGEEKVKLGLASLVVPERAGVDLGLGGGRCRLGEGARGRGRVGVGGVRLMALTSKLWLPSPRPGWSRPSASSSGAASRPPGRSRGDTRRKSRTVFRLRSRRRGSGWCSSRSARGRSGRVEGIRPCRPRSPRSSPSPRSGSASCPGRSSSAAARYWR